MSGAGKPRTGSESHGVRSEWTSGYRERVRNDEGGVLTGRVAESQTADPALSEAERKLTEENARRFSQQLERLARVVQDLSQASSTVEIAGIVLRAARKLAGSDGATFVVREGDLCHYVDEDAVAPLWKGKKFPMSACISGWVMTHHEQVAIEDVYSDPRIPHNAYRPTFVKSLVMTPIRTDHPIGAIGAYWATPHHASDAVLRVLSALADTTSVALKNVPVVAALEQGNARTRAVYDHLPGATFVWRRLGDDFVLADLNKAARNIVAGDATDCVGKGPHELLNGLFQLDGDIARVYEERLPVRREVECTLSGGQSSRHLILTYGFIPDDMVVLYAEDVTHQHQTERQLELAQRLEAVGRLAGGIAHDFNNLLSVILGSVEFALTEIRENEGAREDLLAIREAGERAATLTRQLLAFSRKQLLQPEVVSLNRVVSGMESLLRRLIGEDVELSVVLAAELGHVKVDPGQIEQVIMNLAANSRDAMPMGGRLTLETSNVEVDEAYAAAHVSAKPGPYVLLSVSDSGFGMDEYTGEHLFEPFFTTKESGKGTGLGLATVYGVVKQSGGTIWVYSEQGLGTTVKIYLPREDSGTPSTQTPEGVSIRPRGTETILIVDDEEVVRKLACRVLTTAGYSVLTAADGHEALRTSERHRDEIHLLLTDLVMPGMSGRELAKHLLLVRPDILVVYTSGYTDNAIAHQGVLEPGTNFVGKPFNATTLLRKVQEVLGRAGAQKTG